MSDPELYVMLLREADGTLDMGTSAATPDLKVLQKWMARSYLENGESYVAFKLVPLDDAS